MKKLSLIAVEQFSGKSLFYFEDSEDNIIEAFGSPLWVSKVADVEFPINCLVDIARNIKGRIYDKDSKAKFSSTHNSVNKLVPLGIQSSTMPTQKQGANAF